MASELLVLDSSVGVKWIRDEPGTAQARELLARFGSGDVTLVVPVIFVHEVLDVARRRRGIAFARDIWNWMNEIGVAVVGVDADLVSRMLDAAERYQCSVYDAAAVALAELAGATLVSTDVGAHGAVPGVTLIG